MCLAAKKIISEEKHIEILHRPYHNLPQAEASSPPLVSNPIPTVLEARSEDEAASKNIILKRKAAEIEVFDMTDDLSPPKKLANVASNSNRNAIPFVLQSPSMNPFDRRTEAALLPDKKRETEKETLRLRLEEIEVRRRLLELEQEQAD